MSVRRAVRFLQSSLGCSVDGLFGPETEKKCVDCDPDSTIASYLYRREAYYRALVEKKPDLKVFLKGWLNRREALRRELPGEPGLESAARVDFGTASYIARIPDIGEDPSFDF